MEVLWKNFSSVKFQFPIVSFWPSISGNSRLNIGPVRLLESCPEYFKIIYIKIVNHGRVVGVWRQWRTTILIINYDNVISVIITIAHSKIFTNFDPIPALRHGAETRWLYWFQSREERDHLVCADWAEIDDSGQAPLPIIRSRLQSSLQVKGRTLNCVIWPNHRLRHELNISSDISHRLRNYIPKKFSLEPDNSGARGWCEVAKLPALRW